MSTLVATSGPVQCIPSTSSLPSRARNGRGRRDSSVDTLLRRHLHHTQSFRSAHSARIPGPGPLRVRNEDTSPTRSASAPNVRDSGEDQRESFDSQPLTRYLRENDIPTQNPQFLESRTDSGLILLRPRQDDPVINRAVANSIVLADEQGIGSRSRVAADSLDLARNRLPPAKRKLSLEKTDSKNEKQHLFRRWFHSLHKRATKKRLTVQPRQERWYLDEFDDTRPSKRVSTCNVGHVKHKSSSSWHSSAFITAVKSARLSVSTLSEGPRSRLLRRSNQLQRDESSRRSQSLIRTSLENNVFSMRTMDEESKDRATKRRHTLEELLSSEESYVADLKALVNASILLRRGSEANTFATGVSYASGLCFYFHFPAQFGADPTQH